MNWTLKAPKVESEFHINKSPARYFDCTLVFITSSCHFLFVVDICGNVGTTTWFRSWSLPRLVLMLVFSVPGSLPNRLNRRKTTTRNSVGFCLAIHLIELNCHLQTSVIASESSTTLSPESLHNKFRHLPFLSLQIGQPSDGAQH